MKNIIIASLISICLIGCKSSDEGLIGDKIIEYHVDGNKYAVVVVQDGLSKESAEKEAMKQAAQVAFDQGFRYFKVESASEVSVIKSNRRFSGESSAPKNIYYELIQSGNFGKQPIPSEELTSESVYPGYRLLFSCYESKPPKKAYSVCDYIHCQDD